MTRKNRAEPSPATVASLRSRGFPPLWLAFALLLFGVLAYAPTVRVQFIGDDYIFLDRVRDLDFWGLWSRAHTDFGWYRPWSREFHFWALSRVFGPTELAFRVGSLVLWFAMLALYRAVLERDAGARRADIATLGVASLSLWGVSLTWISGVQDLWMLVFSLFAVRLDQSRYWRWSVVPYSLALLSKETAVMLPLIVLARARIVSRLRWRDAARRLMPLVVVSLAWLVAHPTLVHRLTHSDVQLATGEPPLPPLHVIGSSLRALVNADQLGGAVDPYAWRPWPTVASALVLAGSAWWALRARAGEAAAMPVANAVRLAAFGAVWCIAGWLPLFSKSVSWHAYYGCLGALGAWLTLSVPLERMRRVTVGMLLSLGLLRGAAAATRSWDWGSEWYQTRAGNVLSVIRRQMHALYPSLTPHTRVYFGSIPNNIGLIAGQSPALRVWYSDATLEAGFYSYYRPRGAGEPSGPDLFFHFDSTAGIREVRDDASPPLGLEPGSDWEQDHESLALAFLTSGDRARAARLFERIAEVPYRVDALMFAGVLWRLEGDSLRANDCLAAARTRTGRSPAEIAGWAGRLLESMPPARSSAP